ncbi:MAG: epoxyqueuosine reductase [Clostridia bacterium]|nr:epoxyqueuosine reductase [Clostridia bacterium]
MKDTTMLDTIQSLLGVPACAIPLSICRQSRGYLLDQAGIPSTGTAILFVIPYLITSDVDHPYRNLSLYAVPRDYHGYIKELETTVLPSLQKMYPEHSFKLFSDHSPIYEVDAAARAGLGIIGTNGLLITPNYGSFVFIGEMITDADYTAVTGHGTPDFPADPPVCEQCGACVGACPMGCCDRDRGNCLSALTQKKGVLTPEEETSILCGGLAWGCDICQLSCPHNIRVIEKGQDTTIPYFVEDRKLFLNSQQLSAMTNEAFALRAYAWRGRAVISRNLALLEDQAREESCINNNNVTERRSRP